MPVCRLKGPLAGSFSAPRDPLGGCGGRPVVGGPSWDTVLLVGGASGAAKGAALTYREQTMMEVKEVLLRVVAGKGMEQPIEVRPGSRSL